MAACFLKHSFPGQHRPITHRSFQTDTFGFSEGITDTSNSSLAFLWNIIEVAGDLLTSGYALRWEFSLLFCALQRVVM